MGCCYHITDFIQLVFVIINFFLSHTLKILKNNPLQLKTLDTSITTKQNTASINTSSIQMMHRFECVSRDCVHKVPLNGFRPNLKVPRAHNSTDPRIKPVHHLFYKMGAQKIVKNTTFSFFTDLPDAWQNHASGNFFLPDAWFFLPDAWFFYRTHDF